MWKLYVEILCNIIQSTDHTEGGGARGSSLVQALCYKSENAGSIPDGVTGIFYSYNPSGRTMALGLTQPPTEMGTINVSWG
jgi:hypothetical protein